jgi:WD40 repeat protein
LFGLDFLLFNGCFNELLCQIGTFAMRQHPTLENSKLSHSCWHTGRAQSLHNLRLLYISDMQQMAALYQDADIREMREMLARHIPESEDPDLRDFEWYYWRGKCDSQSASWTHDSSVEKIEISSDGKWVASCGLFGDDTAFQVRDARTGRLQKAFALAGLRVSNFKFRNDREMIVAARGQRETVFVVDWSEGKIATELLSFPANPRMPVSRYAFSDSAELVAFSFMGKVHCYETSTGQSLKIRLPKEADIEQYRRQSVVYEDKDGLYIDFTGVVSGATQTRNGNSVRQSDPTNGVAQYWESQNEFSPGSDQDGGPVISLDFSPSEHLLAAGSRAGRIKIWNRSSGEGLLEFAAHDGIIWDLAFSNDNHLLASAGEDGAIRIWDLSSGGLLSELVGHTGAVNSIDFGKRDHLVSGGVDRLTRVWQLPSKHPLATFRGNEGPLSDVCLSSDARSC